MRQRKGAPGLELMENEKILDYLGSIDLFKGIQQEDLNLILADSSFVSFKESQYLFFQEDPAKTFYVLIEGRIKLSQLTPDGEQVTLHYLSPGEAFGIIAVLREINFPVTAQAVEDCTCVAWSEEKIKKWILSIPKIALNSIRILSNFILNFQDRIRELSTERVERRVARSIIRLATHGGQPHKEGISLGLKLTRQDIAEMSGTTLYTVSRILTKWENLNLVDCKYSSIVVKELNTLTQIAEDIQFE